MTDDEAFDLAGYDYFLPDHLIAQQPAAERSGSRLLVLNHADGSIRDRTFLDIREYFRPGDLLVVNDTKVFPARLLGVKESGGKAEIFLLHYPVLDLKTGSARVKGLLKSSKKIKPGAQIVFGPDLSVRIESHEPDGAANLTLIFTGDLDQTLDRHGRTPLPPYIRRDQEPGQPLDRERYQTVYARHAGAVAAPTAGFHFTDELMADLAAMGVAAASVTLHVGYGTFAPVRCNDIRQHPIHHEHISLPPATAALINRTRDSGGRIFSVGTTTARTLEFTTGPDGRVKPMEGLCDLYIYPGYRFRTVDNLITNFHLPRSSLLFLVSALASRERILASYRHAVSQGYRFFSYGDAMLIITKP